MMKCIITYYELAKKAIIETSRKADRISYAFLKTETSKQLHELTQMKFQDPEPKEGKQKLLEYFRNLKEEITIIFKKLMDS